MDWTDPDDDSDDVCPHCDSPGCDCARWDPDVRGWVCTTCDLLIPQCRKPEPEEDQP